MQVQLSRFLIWGKNDKPLDEMFEIGFSHYTKETFEKNYKNPIKTSKEWKNPLFRIIINGQLKDKIRIQLDNCGINHNTLFPGLDSLGKTIKDKYTYDLDDVLF